ncbi:MAG: rhodanese-like domain-containing protein [Dehalococcoidia bacterium]|nr:rhodanese-like domain-containing protein [Dehalococcoidia bacterium]
MLVESDWLEAHLNDPDLHIVDCDQYDGYRRAHIPNAVGIREHHYIKHPDFPKDPIGHPLVAPPEQVARLMESMGIGNDVTVITYDGSGGNSAARIWWVLNYYGHDKVRVLNGGWAKWLDEGRPITTDVPRTTPATFTSREREDLVCLMDYGVSQIGQPDTIFLDVRSDGEWMGTNDRGNKRAGHIPGAIHLEWLNFVTADSHRTFKPAGELRSLLEENGITPEKQVVTY